MERIEKIYFETRVTPTTYELMMKIKELVGVVNGMVSKGVEWDHGRGDVPTKSGGILFNGKELALIWDKSGVRMEDSFAVVQKAVVEKVCGYLEGVPWNVEMKKIAMEVLRYEAEKMCKGDR